MKSQTLFNHILLTIACVMKTLRVIAADFDDDGLDDGFEQTLIDRHRPLLIYDTGQSYWPISILDFVMNSEVVFKPSGHVVVPNSVLRNDPLSALKGAIDAQRSHAGYHDNSLSGFSLDLADSARRGLHGSNQRGAYAKVSILQSPIIYPKRELRPVGRPGDYLIQYWLLFGYNDDCTIEECINFPFLGRRCITIYDGDHEGDWVYLDVIVDGATLGLREIVHHHHGSSCAVSIQPDEWPLPDDGVPRAYLERNVNEWWPHPSVDDCTSAAGFFGCAVHENSGLTLRTEGVKNVGERLRPMMDMEAQLFVLFNGDWGNYKDGPDAPIFQRWIGTPPSRIYVSNLERQPLLPKVSHALGSRYNPFESVDEAALAAAKIIDSVTHFQIVTLVVTNGSYGVSGTIASPVQIEAAGGVVTLTLRQ